MLGIELCSSLSRGEQLRRASELSGRLRWPSDEDMIRARACGGGMRTPDSCGPAAAAFTADVDAPSSARRARLAAASTAAGSTCAQGNAGYSRRPGSNKLSRVQGLSGSRIMPS